MDYDVSCINPFPVRKDDDMVSVQIFSHSSLSLTLSNSLITSPYDQGSGSWHNGLLEHWLLLYSPRHPLINRTLANIEYNLLTNDCYRCNDTDHVMWQTGPGPYLKALHDIVKEMDCVDPYTRARGPNIYSIMNNFTFSCPPERLEQFRMANARIFQGVNLGDTTKDKFFKGLTQFVGKVNPNFKWIDYDQPAVARVATNKSFCLGLAYHRK